MLRQFWLIKIAGGCSYDYCGGVAAIVNIATIVIPKNSKDGGDDGGNRWSE